jgi:hypothetical protein
VQKVDSFGARALDRVDEQFPAIKKPMSELYNESKNLILFPLQKVLEGRDIFLQVYINERKKNEEQPIWSQGKAAGTAAYVVTNDTISWVTSLIKQKKEDAKRVASEKINQ